MTMACDLVFHGILTGSKQQHLAVCGSWNAITVVPVTVFIISMSLKWNSYASPVEMNRWFTITGHGNLDKKSCHTQGFRQQPNEEKADETT